jgi:hypothetical protein
MGRSKFWSTSQIDRAMNSDEMTAVDVGTLHLRAQSGCTHILTDRKQSAHTDIWVKTEVGQILLAIGGPQKEMGDAVFLERCRKNEQLTEALNVSTCFGALRARLRAEKIIIKAVSYTELLHFIIICA